MKIKRRTAAFVLLFILNYADAAGLVVSASKISDRNNCMGLGHQRLAVKAGILQLNKSQFKQLLSPLGDSNEVSRHVVCSQYIAGNLTSKEWANSAIAGVQLVSDPLGTAPETIAKLLYGQTNKHGLLTGGMAVAGAATSWVSKTNVTKGAVIGAGLGAAVGESLDKRLAYDAALAVASLAKKEGFTLIDEGQLHAMTSEQEFDELLEARQLTAHTQKEKDHLLAIQMFAAGMADRVEQNCR